MKMQYSGVVFLLLATCACASLNNNGIEGGDRVVLVAPVLAPPKDSKPHEATRSRQFPILVLLSQQNSAQPETKSLPVNPELVYVQKLEDQVDPVPYRSMREKRSFKNKGGGGTTVIVVPVNTGGARGGGGRRGGGRWHYGNQGCGGCGGYPLGGGYPRGGNYGGGGTSYASASATAYASGKR